MECQQFMIEEVILYMILNMKMVIELDMVIQKMIHISMIQIDKQERKIWKILDYQGEDIKVDIPENGNYCIMVADENKALWDITELVDMEVIGDAEDWIIPLE